MKKCVSCNKPFDAPVDSWKCPSCGFSPEKVDGFLAFAPQSAKSGSGFRTESFEGSYNLETRNFWFKAKKQLLRWAFKKFFPGAKKYLEAGCGTGFFLNDFESSFPDLNIFGSDLFIEGIKSAATRAHRSQLIQMDLMNIPFYEEFDAIGAFDVLEHIPSDTAVLDQFLKAVKPGSGILITVPHHPFLWTWIDDFLCHVRRYTGAELRRKVQDAGFTIIKQTSFVSLLFPLMLMQRLFHKLFPPKSHDPQVDLKINPLLNWIFEAVMSFELRLIQSGISFPFGGSILLIAKKK
jgi:SAM-dependent methyltransferase